MIRLQLKGREGLTRHLPNIYLFKFGHIPGIIEAGVVSRKICCVNLTNTYICYNIKYIAEGIWIAGSILFDIQDCNSHKMIQCQSALSGKTWVQNSDFTTQMLTIWSCTN